MMNLIDRIAELMASDTESTDKQSAYLERAYREADAAGKEALDEAFTALCGYSLTTLLNDRTI